MLSDFFDLGSAEILGMGNYGFVLTCNSVKTGQCAVVKLQSQRWVTVAVREWAHGSELGVHPNIVEYVEAVMHRDNDKEIEQFLDNGFKSGALKGKRPKLFPDCYFCLALEYMNRGTVQN